MVATAFCGCDDEDAELIPVSDSSPAAETVKEYEENKEAEVSSGEETAHAEIMVYVCGAVMNPDVYTLESGSRLVDAVAAAGGFAEDAGADFLNLASKVADGQKIYIPTNAEIEEAFSADDGTYAASVNITSNAPGIENIGDASGNSQNGTDGKVNINQASRETLMTLPGIGQSKADLIIAYREENGGFKSIEDIMLVGGIKEGLFNKVKDKICVE